MLGNIATASWGQWPVTDHERFHLGSSDVTGYASEDVDDADADEEE
jgi:hypothetical protein